MTLRDKLKTLKLSADPRILTHDINALNIKIAEAQYFYKDIVGEGVLLYDTKNFELATERELTKEEQKRLAKDSFKSYFDRAQNFFIDYKNAFERKDFKGSAFHLHQSAEHALKTILLVFENSCPHEHYLQYLQDDIEDFYPQIKDFFKQESRKDEIRVKLLEYAYIGGRYDPDYHISKEDLEILAKEVEGLLEVTERICEKKIKSYNT